MKLDKVEETIGISQQKGAAMVKQLATNPDKYIMLRKAGYKDILIPS